MLILLEMNEWLGDIGRWLRFRGERELRKGFLEGTILQYYTE